MSTNYQKDIKYTNRDFSSIREDLINFIKQYYPDYGNFSDTSSSMMLLELVAYVGDVLNFYMDESFKELFLDTAKERKNLIALGKLLGYKYKGKVPSVVDIEVSIVVPARTIGGEVTYDPDYLLNLEKGTILVSSTETPQYFEILEDADFTKVKDENITVYDREDPDIPDSTPTKYLLKMYVGARNGENKTYETTIDSFEAFKEITLPDQDVVEIKLVEDENDNIYGEVEYLAQDSILKVDTNSATSVSTEEKIAVPYLISLQKAPYRYIKNVDENGYTYLTFGSGQESISDESLVPNPYKYVLPPSLGSGSAYVQQDIDPANYLDTTTLGISPVGDLTINYKIGGGLISNVPANTIDTISERYISWPRTESYYESLTSGIENKLDVLNSLTVINLNDAQGGLDEPSIEELRHYAAAAFAGQKRAVTIQDYISLLNTMPNSFGNIFRAYAESANRNSVLEIQVANDNTKNYSNYVDSSIFLYLLSLNSDGNLVQPYDSLKNNIESYLSRYRMINDTIYILPAKIINIGINYSVVIESDYNRDDVLYDCNSVLEEKFKIDNMNFNKAIVYSEIYKELQQVSGVLSVVNIEIVNIHGTYNSRTYSDTIYAIEDNKINGILKSNPRSIFEIKFPKFDIIGKSITN